MTYSQSEMYNCANYLKNLPLQSVSSRGNLQVVGGLYTSIRLLRLHSRSTFYNMTLITTVRNQHNQMVD